MPSRDSRRRLFNQAASARSSRSEDFVEGYLPLPWTMATSWAIRTRPCPVTRPGFAPVAAACSSCRPGSSLRATARWYPTVRTGAPDCSAICPRPRPRRYIPRDQHGLFCRGSCDCSHPDRCQFLTARPKETWMRVHLGSSKVLRVCCRFLPKSLGEIDGSLSTDRKNSCSRKLRSCAAKGLSHQAGLARTQ